MSFVVRRGAAFLALALFVAAIGWGLVGGVGPALVLAVAGLFMLLLGLGTGTRAATAPTTPVEVPPEEIELREGAITACLRCGSVDVGGGSAMQGMIPGAGDAFAVLCRRCGHRGTPLAFDDATAYREFVKGLNEAKD